MYQRGFHTALLPKRCSSAGRWFHRTKDTSSPSMCTSPSSSTCG